MPLARYCTILLAFFCSCSLWALEHSDTYADLGTRCHYSQFTFSEDATWTANPQLPYTSVIGCGTQNLRYVYTYSDLHPFVDIPYTGGSLRSAQLSNVTSVTIILARTADSYTAPFHVILESATTAEPTNFSSVTTIDAVNYISSTSASSYTGSPYDPAHFTAYTYNFDTPFSGVLQFRFPPASASLQDTYKAYIPYFMIADISLTVAQPCNCFSVTVH